MNNNFKMEAKQYFKIFKIPFIIFGVLLVVFAGVMISRFTAPVIEIEHFYESTNTQRVYGDKRVFDFGDQLTDDEERKLEAYIHECEKLCINDIVIVTLNQSLKDYEPEYKSRYTMSITPDKYVMVYADKFWEDNKFGYDCPQVLDGTTWSGDGVILVDNVYREDETGRIYTWLGTTGYAEETYSSSMIDHALDVFYKRVEYDYYGACVDFVDQVTYDLGGYADYGPIDKRPDFQIEYLRDPFIIGALFAIIFFFVNFRQKAGKKTVTEKTYLIGGRVSFPVRDDIFLRKSVTKRYNPPSSSGGSSGGGGGGHHVSGGGGSHGGGGHSR